MFLSVSLYYHSSFGFYLSLNVKKNFEGGSVPGKLSNLKKLMDPIELQNLNQDCNLEILLCVISGNLLL